MPTVYGTKKKVRNNCIILVLDIIYNCPCTYSYISQYWLLRSTTLTLTVISQGKVRPLDIYG